MDEGHTRTGKPRSSLEKPRVTALLAGKMGLAYKGLSNLCNHTAVGEELRPRMFTEEQPAPSWITRSSDCLSCLATGDHYLAFKTVHTCL